MEQGLSETKADNSVVGGYCGSRADTVSRQRPTAGSLRSSSALATCQRGSLWACEAGRSREAGSTRGRKQRAPTATGPICDRSRFAVLVARLLSIRGSRTEGPMATERNQPSVYPLISVRFRPEHAVRLAFSQCSALCATGPAKARFCSRTAIEYRSGLRR